MGKFKAKIQCLFVERMCVDVDGKVENYGDLKSAEKTASTNS